MPGPAEKISSAESTFFQQLKDQAATESFRQLNRADLDKLGWDLWHWASELDIGERAVRFKRLTHGCLLEASSPDMPFLVDSILTEAAAQAINVDALLHPIVDMPSGERRSIIQLHLPDLDEDEATAIDLGVRRTMDDIVAAVRDYQAMRTRMQLEIAILSEQGHLKPERRDEAVAFLDWLSNEHFVFLGARTYTFKMEPNGTLAREEPEIVEGTSLGLLKDESLNVLSRDNEPSVITPAAAQYLQDPDPLIISKASYVSRVHRRVAADYIGVKRYDEQGRVIGETRFIGLFTSEAYSASAQTIPVLRSRMKRVMEASGTRRGTHSAKALAHIVETWPRDELLQTSAGELLPMVLGALSLVGRPRTRVFIRRDLFDRFLSAVVYVSRDAYDTALREQIVEILEAACDGKLMKFEPRFNDGPLLQIYFTLTPGPKFSKLDEAALEREIAGLARTWDEAFREAVSVSPLEGITKVSTSRYRGAFNVAYREAFSPEEALKDVSELSQLNGANPVRMRAYKNPSDRPDEIRAKIYAAGEAIPLSDCVPVLENMGLFVASETGYPVTPETGAAETLWVHDLSMRSASGQPIDLEKIGEIFAETFVSVWTGQAENDAFNQLVFGIGATWREAALMRTLCAYRSQTGQDPSQPVQVSALSGHPEITRKLLDLFATKFDPASPGNLEERSVKAEAVRAEIDVALNKVSSLDEDRVLRRVADLIMAVQRTNFYHSTYADTAPAGFIAIKIASQQLTHLPDPKPFREIFTSSPRVDGVHCRFGPIARGGLRWSDRRDDFRTEVLGLVKAQQVKNAVIVPVGSKGGFFPKQLPVGGTREEIGQAGVAAYKEFITALLSITDNLVEGEVKHPNDTVIWDGEDPYLVVAADKGTATFSDTANAISVAHNFWLGDAFASGGSAGYDHKKMGITARGAWEAVKRHFREIGKDIQSEPFTVIGVGDMSGDVFGNGMLLSKQIKLQAAFNHLHIFVDPDPEDVEANWKERKRLFDLPRSLWTDYDRSLISKGGDIFDRSAKSIDLSDEIKAMTGLTKSSVTPDELLHALLKSECELLWFGGIGTYIKAESETHDDAGDRSNDLIRVNGNEVRAKVIGEGANLGVTQAGRIEFASKGGRLNTDAIDNSAGVDSSDHEVNIKILCAEAIRRGDLKSDARDDLLASMTEDVGLHVLRHNYDQTGALSLAEATADEDHDALERLMVWLEQRGVLDREVEGLPSTIEMAERAADKKYLTRPELSVLLAWSKIVLFDEIVSSELPSDPYFAETLEKYFPLGIRKFEHARASHRLRAEIIATVLSNRLLDAGGPAFLMRLREVTGQGGAEIARAFEVMRAALDANDLSNAINALDNQVPAKLQTAMQVELAYVLSRGTLIVIDDARPVGTQLAEVKPAFDAYRDCLDEVMKPHVAGRVKRRAKIYEKQGAPEGLARQIASLRAIALGPHILKVARKADRPMKDAVEAFFTFGHALKLDWLRTTAEDGLYESGYWDRRATYRLLADLIEQQSQASVSSLSASPTATGKEAAEAWLSERKDAVAAFKSEMETISVEREASFAKYSLIADAARAVIAQR